MMKIKLLLFILPVFFLAACQEKEHELPDNTDPVNVPRYASNMSFHSNLLSTNIAFDILLPEDYVSDTDKRYPVVYCFHGYGNDNTSWNNGSLTLESKVQSMEKKGLQPMIYVIPNGLKSYFCDRFNGSYQYMTMLVSEFIPYIDKSYRTIADKQHRAIIGYSMGGFGSIATAMQHPDMFCASAGLSISMRTDEQYMTESQSAWDNQWGRIFGGSGTTGKDRLTDYYKSICPLHQFTAENVSKYSGVEWFICCGDNEKTLLYGNDDLHTMMVENGYVHEYRVGEGGHSESYWNPMLNEIIPWFAYVMDGGKDWEQSTYDVNVPAGYTPSANGIYVSEGYTNTSEDKALYLFYKDVQKAWIDDAIAILQRGIQKKKFVILPCDTSEKTPEEWVALYSVQYPAGTMQAVALGKGASATLLAQSHFSTLYFDNASFDSTDALQVDKNRYYYLSQCDQNPDCAGTNALYKACKESEASFDYRCRNHLNDTRTDFLTGIEYIKASLRNF